LRDEVTNRSWRLLLVDLKFDENEAENSEKRHFYGIIFRYSLKYSF